MRKRFSLLLFFLFFSVAQLSAQLVANAGVDKILCPNSTVTIGGTPAASGGTAPYSYSWLPTTGLSNAAVSNPVVTVSVTTTYTLTIQDSNDSIRTDVVNVTVDDVKNFSAGPDKEVCAGATVNVQLGASANYQGTYTFLWSPAASLNNATLPKPTASPTVTTTYTLTVTSTNCGSFTSTVDVNIHFVSVDAGPDTTITEGQTITLIGTPTTAVTMSWYSPTDPNINYSNTSSPDVEPNDTTYYYFTITDSYGCSATDYVIVRVIPSNEPVFFNTFTPNGDSNNDFFYIGNLEKYPDNKLEIYNRYGQLIFTKNKYENDWNGTYLGQEVPSGTYFYIFDTKSAQGKYRGSVTIIR